MTEDALIEDPIVEQIPISELDEKVQTVFGNLAIDKRRLPMSQLQKRGVPAYVAEWVLDSITPGSGPLTKEESEKLQRWVDRFIPGPGDANLIKNRLMDGDMVKVLTNVQVEIELNRKRQDRVAVMKLLGINDAYISEGLIAQYPDLLNQGMWGVVELVNTPDGVILDSFRPMQATVNLALYKEARSQFSLEEWRSLMITSMGYNPDAFSPEQQLLLLSRLLPLVQKNMHMIELAPKGTGKSYIYENISPQVRLISGGNVSPAVLFVNNATNQWGILARYSVVVLDEVQTLRFDSPSEIIGGLKGYLANGRLTRGGRNETASDAGLVLLANIMLDSRQQPLLDPIVQELPDFMQETAFLDRMRALIPGWELPKLNSNSFAHGVGLKSDFFGDALLALRNDLEMDQLVARRIQLTGRNIYKRNQDAVHAIASGMVKLLFPHGRFSDEELAFYCVRPAKILRQNIWDQLQKLDGEYRQYESRIEAEVLPEPL
jgi:ATP-dependent Lon protease